ncbi:hypothetical protein BCS89_00710 [Vibrio splendidus]|nr:hypothetical protein BCS97_06810 [Vibrio splendidus]PMP28589.1 hypothetical protein BCS88_02295 [Vibrio splendidus]PMP35248.1 hypothetical protein BCS89_00710 [Vibrio splendidus]PMP39102.1 hypothetical protein BCS87_11610 [Vibrio splendidus]PMP47990.1 hypothetical protein BCS85_10950 [Vibrio splendidus]
MLLSTGFPMGSRNYRVVIQKDHYVVGTYQDRKLYILLFGGEPKHHQIKGLEQDGKNNVFGLF